ncbi:hemolysin family protein [Actinoplanes sp. NEAU-A12]|uniref:Hemolysin family protein n=1 Tax=Actinoplanes sandaracinus TaxID=3045177 RepID=A0ABT6WT99_9ACTN|nr:hemolysin family protein [Actinoplanes sandaracinus]MDI6099019.1 hemolysin family protein [Actinoplanes sandaracinus]MDI6102914.1 hemolysin family protein [Actinoplanes sandaracinus]
MDGLFLTAVLPLAAFALLTVGNAFFVAAEFGLVTVDRVEIDVRATAGDRQAARVRTALHELSFQLSGAQLGITLTALLTGYLAAPALSKIFAPLVEPLAGSSTDTVTRVVSLIAATLISMLFGELVPKNAALARPMGIALRTAAPLRGFSIVFKWLIAALNGTANWLVRRLGIEPQEELASARSPEELGLLAAISASAGALPTETAVLLRRTIRFGEKRAAKAMTPRVDVVGLKTTASVADLITVARETGHTRFPVYENTLDAVTGVVGVNDALGVPPERRAVIRVSALAREPVYVPESLSLDKVLTALRAAGADLAIVVDEYGGTDGVVTVEDLIEELVGEIADEHDTDLGETGTSELTAPGGEKTFVVDGLLREDEVHEQTGFRLPEGPYETLAGFLLARLGHIPIAGESLEENGWEFTVLEVDRHRIEQVRVVVPPEPVDE